MTFTSRNWTLKSCKHVLTLVLIVTIVTSASFTEAASTDLQQQVQGHLEAGEFSNALELAGNIDDQAERNEILSMIAQAQIESGLFDQARATLRMTSMTESRVKQQAKRVGKSSLAGTNADFDSLIQLIQSQTEGPWEDIDGIGGTINEFETGVRVDPQGLLARLSKTETKRRLQDMRLESRDAGLNDDLSEPSSLRMVSLTRLEAAIRERQADGHQVAESMRNLAGIYSVQYVFVYPETGEIVLAGPAAGWSYDQNGWPVSKQNSLPTLQLDDLVTVLRTFSNEGMNIFGCSINPREEGMRELKSYVESSQKRGSLSPTAVRGWARQLQNKLGLQDIEIYGIPADSRVARVIVEADYRMKLIGIGKLEGGSQIPDYFELMTQEQVTNVSQLDALRWWLSVNCDAILQDADAQAFELQNSSVLCQSENQFVNAQGQHVPTGKSEATNQQFASNFTSHYDQLAEQQPIFADLQNIFDLALVAAIIKQHQLAEQSQWDLGQFASGGLYQPARYETPLVVDSVVNHRVFGGRNIVVQVAGGVRADLMALAASPQKTRISPRLSQVAKTAQPTDTREGRWWWDARK